MNIGVEYLTLRPIEKSDIDTVVAICDGCVGKGLYTRQEIADTVGSDSQFLYVLQTDEGRLVGYVYFALSTISELAEYTKLETTLLQSVCREKTNSVGKIQSVAIIESCRGKHLSTKLIEFALQCFRNIGIETVFIACWKKGNAVPLEKSVTRCGFHHLATAQKIWYQNKNLFCPYCNGRCTCDAEVYYNQLGDLS